MACNEITLTLRKADGFTFNVKVDTARSQDSAEHAWDDPVPAHPMLSELARNAAKVLRCHISEVRFILETKEVNSDDVFRRLGSKIPVLDIVRTPPITVNEATELKLRMQRCGVRFERGLTYHEIMAAECHFGIVFPPELKAFYSIGLPVGRHNGKPFPNWRDLTQTYATITAEAVETLLHKVGPEEDPYKIEVWWKGSEEYPGWGKMPASYDECRRVAEAALAYAPRIVPIYGPCITASSDKAGSPVYNLYKHPYMVGADLADYLSNQFEFKPVRSSLVRRCDIPPMPFWGDIDY
jgi:hypothetical protein